jgi:hypothetical protein
MSFIDVTRSAEPELATASLWRRVRPILVEVATTAVFFGIATIAYFVLLGLLFQSGLLSGVRVLFYRGIGIMLVLTPLFALATAWVGSRSGLCSLRDALGAALVAASLNFTFFTLGPVTVDRSISIFINGQMAAAPDRIFSAAEVDQLFRDRYLTGMDQIARRMEEQEITGTMVRVGNGYRITDKGKALISNSRWMAWMFQTDQRLLDAPKR